MAQPAPTGYGGVVPGTGNVPEGIAAEPGSTRVVTWPGFQMTPDGGSRVFVQTAVPVKPELRRAGAGFVVVIPGVTLPAGNARLAMDTQYFKTPVQRVQMKQTGNAVTVTIDVKGKTKPTLRTEKAANGYFFTFVEFAPV